MSRFLKSVLGLLCLLVVVAGGLAVLERRESASLARELRSARSEVSELRALNEGLEEAVADLRDQLNTLRNEPAVFLTMANPETDSEYREDLEEEEGADDWNGPQEANGPRPTLTPEEKVEQEEREERRREWREERERRRKEFRERMTEELAYRKQFFSQVSTEGLAPEYREAHTQLLASMDRMQGVMRELGNPELERGERRELMREIFRLTRDTGELMDMQRDVLLNDYAQQALGLGDAETREFIDYMQTVNEMTNPAPMHGGGRGGGR